MGLLLTLLLVFGVDDPTKGPRVVGRVEGSAVEFSAGDRQLLTGAVVGLLDSCCFSMEIADEVWAASTKRDYLSIFLRHPIKVKNEEKEVETRELVLVLPLARGAVRVRSGDRAYTFSKYTWQAAQEVEKVLRKARFVQPDDRTK